MNKLTKIIAAMLFLISTIAHSLSVGEIKLYSVLNQKLNAEISLVLNAGEHIDDIKVDMATADEFNKLGLSRDYFISKIKLQPMVKANGKAVIKVTSEQVLQEPILDFLVQVNWSNGELYKEFTVLINPHLAYQQQDTRTLTAPVLHPKKIIQSKDSAIKIQNVQNDSSRLDAPRVYVSLNKGDSLWSVAKKVNRHNDVFVMQMIMALYKANPAAFYKQNINSLIGEGVLKIPDKSTILKLSKEQARQQFYKQMASWEGKTVEPVEALKSETIEPELAVKTAETMTDSSKLTLIPLSEDNSTQAIALANNNKKIEKIVSENLQLQQRLDKLEKELTMMQEMMAITDQQFETIKNQQLEAIKNQQLVKKNIPAIGQTTVDKQQFGNDSSVNYFYLLGTGVVILLGFGYLLRRKLQAKKGNNEINIFSATDKQTIDESQDKTLVPVSLEKAFHETDAVDEISSLDDATSDEFSTDQSKVDPSLEADRVTEMGSELILDADLFANDYAKSDDLETKKSDDLEALEFNDDSTETVVSSSKETKTTSPTENDDFMFDLDYTIANPQQAEATDLVKADKLDIEVADLTDADEVETKIDLAKAYIEMSDLDVAKMLAQEVLELGNDAQKLEAKAIIDSLNQ